MLLTLFPLHMHTHIHHHTYMQMVSHLTCKDVDTYRGIVLGIRRNGPDSRFSIADVFLGTPILNNIPLYSPFVKSIKVSSKSQNAIGRGDGCMPHKIEEGGATGSLTLSTSPHLVFTLQFVMTE